MKIISRPKKEKKILASVKKDAKTDEIRKSIAKKGEYCVNPLCGCSNCK